MGDQEDQVNGDVPPEFSEELHEILREGRTHLRQRQQKDPHHYQSERFFAAVERDGDSVLVTWQRLRQFSGEYTLHLSKIVGLVDPVNFQGASEIHSSSADGTFTDNDVEEGRQYLYYFVFRYDERTKIDEIQLPMTVPLSETRLQQLEELEEAENLTPAQRLRREAEEFLEVEEALDEAHEKAKEKINNNPKYLSDDDKKHRISRIDGFFRTLRTKMG